MGEWPSSRRRFSISATFSASTKARVWPWEHSDWFKPYVAGYYAFAYLGEDLTRAEVEARLDELLALERIA